MDKLQASQYLVKHVLDHVLIEMICDQSSETSINVLHDHVSLLVIVIAFDCLYDVRAAVEHHEACLDDHFCFLFGVLVLVVSTVFDRVEVIHLPVFDSKSIIILGHSKLLLRLLILLKRVLTYKGSSSHGHVLHEVIPTGQYGLPLLLDIFKYSLDAVVSSLSLFLWSKPLFYLVLEFIR
jgi:hypothetical protein